MDRCPTCGVDVRAGEAVEVRFRARGGRFDSVQCAVAGLGMLCDRCAAPLLGRVVVGAGDAIDCGRACEGHGAREPAARAKHDVAEAMANPAGAGRRL